MVIGMSTVKRFGNFSPLEALMSIVDYLKWNFNKLHEKYSGIS